MSQQQQSQALQPVTRVVTGKLTRLSDIESRVLSTSNPEQANIWINDIQETKAQLVAPAQSVPEFPEGYGIVASKVEVTNFANDTYPIKGQSNKFGLHKAKLDEIGRAYGIDWPKEWTFVEPYDADDPRRHDPYCIKITVAGRYKHYDGSWVNLPALTKEIDLREDSDEVKEIRANHLWKETSDLPKDATPEAKADRQRIAQRKANAEIAQLRKFIRMHAQTKARLAVIRTLVRTSYTREELQAGFWVVRTVFTAKSDDPEIRAIYARAIAQRELGANNLLFGDTQPKHLPPAPEEPTKEQAGVVEDVDLEAVVKNAIDEAAAGETQEQPAQQQQQQQPQCTPDKCYKGGKHVKACFDPVEEPQHQQAQDSWTITRGKYKDKKISDVEPEALSQLRDYYTVALEDGDMPDLQRQEFKGELAFVEAEIKRRGLFEHAAKG